MVRKNFLTTGRLLKILLLLGSAFCLAVVIFFGWTILKYDNLRDDSAKTHEAILDLETQQDTLWQWINSQPTPFRVSHYRTYQETLERQDQLSGEELEELRDLRSSLPAKILPEYKERIVLQIVRMEQATKEIKLQIEWYKEAQKPEPDEEKLLTLLKEIEREQKISEPQLATANRLSKEPYPSRLSLIFSHLWTALLFLFISLVELICVGGILILLVKRKTGSMLSSLFWLVLGIIDLLVLVLSWAKLSNFSQLAFR